MTVTCCDVSNTSASPNLESRILTVFYWIQHTACIYLIATQRISKWSKWPKKVLKNDELNIKCPRILQFPPDDQDACSNIHKLYYVSKFLAERKHHFTNNVQCGFPFLADYPDNLLAYAPNYILRRKCIVLQNTA